MIDEQAGTTLLPDFQFRGTDGKVYTIGPTPREFEKEAMSTLVNTAPQDLLAGTLPNFLDTVDRWIWMHLRILEGQQHIRQEDVQGLYFCIDRPTILDYIFRRLTDSLAASAQTVNVMADGLKSLTDIFGKREEVKPDGHPEPERADAIQPGGQGADSKPVRRRKAPVRKSSR